MEAVGVEGEAVLDQELERVGALRARAPAHGAAAGAILDHGDGLLHHLVFFIARQVAGNLVIVAMAFDDVAVVEDGLHGFRKALRDRAAGQERRLDVLFLEDSQQPIDRVVRAVFALAPHLVVQNAVLVRFDVFAALEIESEKDRGALAVRPTDQVIVVIFLESGEASQQQNCGPKRGVHGSAPV